MLIRIMKELLDVPEFKRPFLRKVFDVKEILEARYNPTQNNIKVIEVKGQRVCVLNEECEVIKV